MIISKSNDISKDLNVKLGQTSTLHKSDKLKTFEVAFNKKLNDKIESKAPESLEDCNDSVEKSSSVGTKKQDNRIAANDDSKLKEELDKISDKLEELNKKSGSKEDISNSIDELITMINDLIAKLNLKDNNVNLSKDGNMENSIAAIKIPMEIDIINTKKIDLNSELKEIVKLLEPMKNTETLEGLSNIKSNVDALKESIQVNDKNQKGLENVDLQSQIINELKVALVSKSKGKENINNINKEDSVAGDKNISSSNIKIENENKASNSNDEFKGNEGNNKNSTSSEGKTIKKEESFLDSLVNDKDKNSINKFVPGTISKVNTFEAALSKTSESAQSVNKANVAEGIVKNIKFMQANNLKELTVSMNPKDLGTMIIKISVEDGKLSAKIIAEKKETFDVINSNIADVKNALGNGNDKVQQVSVDIKFGDSTTYEQFKEGQGYQGNEKRYANSQDNLVVDESKNEEKTEDDLYGDSVVNMLA